PSEFAEPLHKSGNPLARGVSRLEPLLDQTDDAWIADRMLHEADQPVLTDLIEEAADISIQYPVHLCAADTTQPKRSTDEEAAHRRVCLFLQKVLASGERPRTATDSRRDFWRLVRIYDVTLPAPDSGGAGAGISEACGLQLKKMV